MKTILVDDERLARKELSTLLNDYDFIEVVDECANVDEALISIKKHQPDLIFLDIQMPEKTGFDLLEELENIPQVVFVTAFDEYAIKAFEVNATDYILKPVDPKRLDQIMNKLEGPKRKTETEQGSKLGYDDQIFIKDGDNCWFVKLSEIRLFESVGNYVKVYFGDNKPMLLRSLNKIEERLDEKEFFRVNRKHIVNMTWVEKVDSWFSGGLKLTLKNGEEIEVSRRQSQRFRENRSL
jgi:two-component system, LytTR family, response regulator